MHPFKQEILADLFVLLKAVCKDITSPKQESDINPIVHILGIQEKEAKEIIKKLIVALPDTLFKGAYIYNNQLMQIKNHSEEHILNTMKMFIIQKYMLFQAQENIQSEDFTNNLINFIYEIHNCIRDAIISNNIQLTTKPSAIK